MSEDVKKVAQEQAEQAYEYFMKFCKYFSWGILVIFLVLAKCNFGVDGTGSKSDPALYEEYKERMQEMNEEFKKRKYGN